MATFDAASGVLLRLGDLEVQGPRVDVWRAQIDNDHGADPGDMPLSQTWLHAGLHWIRHKVLDLATDDEGLTVRTSILPDGTDIGLFAD